MTGYVRTCDGRRLTLPALLQWSVRLTDGDPCDSFSVRFLYEAELSEALRKAVLFEAEELGRTAFTGVVDDYEIRMDKKGLLVEMTGRGLAALLLDNQVRAAEYVRAQLEDILSTYVRPYGIVNIRAAAMPPVERFVVETGYTCWQVLAGFCRHSAEIFPRFLPDGTLELRVRDNGRGLPPELLGPYRPPEKQTGHLGLFNVDTILKKHYGERFGLRLENNTAGGGACIIAVLPAGRRDSQC